MKLKKKFKGFVGWITHLKNGCHKFKVVRRWIRINQKKNKPPETIYELLKICKECDKIVSSAYLNEEELKEILTRQNGHIQAVERV